MTDRRWVPWLLWLGLLVAAVAALYPLRDEIEQSHIALTLMLIVLGGSAGGGRRLGITLALIGFVVIDYYFQPPFDSLKVNKTLDWVVLLAFLAAAFVATELLTRARTEAERARRHAEEVIALSKAAEEAQHLRAANRAKDEVLGAVSHDLRTPLATIKVLAQRSRVDERAAPLIEEEVDRLTKMVADLLDLSRIRIGDMALEREINTAEDLVGAAIQRVQGVRDGRTINARLDMGSPALAGRFDLVHSLRIVGNLLDNALRHSPPRGAIDVETARDDSWMVVRIADRGPGIAAGEAERIFQPFYRPSSGPPDSGHAGLGLSIALQLAELQGGTVTYSPRSGGGSVFTLRLPAAQWEPGEMPEE